MAAPHTTLPDLDLLDQAGLKALILSQYEQLLSHQSQIEHLKLLIAKLRRMQFGRKSEKLDRQIEQLELRLEELQSRPADNANQAETKLASPPSLASTPQRHLARCPIIYHVKPRGTNRRKRRVRVAAASCTSWARMSPKFWSTGLPASCGPSASKLSCTGCAVSCRRQLRVGRSPGYGRPGLLAHALVSKYADHLPLYRQSEIYARQGVELERSTLADWVGGTSRLLEPLVEVLFRYVTAASKLHADDTPVPVLAPGNGKTKTGRLWTYVRDDRPAGDAAAPAVWFAYSPDRKGEHPEQHLRQFHGILQADAYAGFQQLYENGRIQEAACWAHVRRKFYDLQQAHASPKRAPVASHRTCAAHAPNRRPPECGRPRRVHGIRRRHRPAVIRGTHADAARGCSPLRSGE